MKNRFYFTIVLLLVAFFDISCGGDPHVHEYDPVTQLCSCTQVNPLAIVQVGTARFLNLQSAVDYIKQNEAPKGKEGYVIKFLKNASGDGVSVSGISSDITFDFGSFSYELTGSKGFEFSNTNVTLSGGTITVSSSASVNSVISVSGANLTSSASFEGSINVGTGAVMKFTGGDVRISSASIADANSIVIESNANLSVPDSSVASTINAAVDVEKTSGNLSLDIPCNHNWDSGTVFPGTCSVAEYTLYTCSLCGDHNKIALPTHNVSHVEAKTSTCISKGNIEYWYCNDCQKYYSDAECRVEISAISIETNLKKHDMTHYIYHAATCTSDGNNDCYYCSLCKQYYENSNGTVQLSGSFVIPALTHKPTQIAYKAATCTENGIMECVYCENCKKYFTDSTLKEELEDPVLYALGHDWKVAADGKHYCARPGCNQASPHTPIWSEGKKECKCDCSQSANNKHYLYHCTVCNHDYAEPEGVSSTATIGGFEVVFPEQKIICANAHFGDSGTEGYVWIETNSGSVPVTVLGVMIDTAHPAQLKDGKYVIQYTGTIAEKRDYIVDIYITAETFVQPLMVRKLFSRTVY